MVVSNRETSSVISTAYTLNNIPPTMRALVAEKKCTPSEYVIGKFLSPTIKRPDDIIIRVHAAGMTYEKPCSVSFTEK